MNILIVGLGSIARKHILSLKTINAEFTLYALRSGAVHSKEPGIINIYSLDALNVKIDFAIISNPTYLHYSFIDQLAELSIPLFIEKPVVNTLQNTDALVNKINASKLKTYVACNLRFHPCIKFIKDAINASKLAQINEVNIYCGSYLPDWRPETDYKKGYSANKNMGGGVHLDLFHELDYAVWLFGFPETTSSVLRSNSSLNIDAIDYANYILQYPNFTASIILNYYRRKAKREITIVFDEFTWVIDLINAKITDDENNVIFTAPGFKILDTYPAQMDYFIGYLNDKENELNTIANSLNILKICLENED